MTREPRDPLQQRLDLSMVDHIGKRVTHSSPRSRRTDSSPQRRRDWLADELPEDGSQFRLAVERQPVIDAPDLAGRVSQTVANLPVGVVDDVVEQDHPFDGRVAAAPEVVAILAVAWLHVELNAADTVRTIADNGRRNQVPSRPAAKEIGGELTEIEGALRKVIERRRLREAYRWRADYDRQQPREPRRMSSSIPTGSVATR